jgi:signal transduction histidine kinase
MRLPPIRFVISLLLLLGVLNAVLFGTMSLVLWGAVRDSPDAERLSAVRSFDATFSGAHGSALETTAQAAPVLDGVFERLASAEATLAPIGTDAEPVIDELRTYVRSLKDWNAALESHPSVVPPTGDIRRGGLRVSAQALRLIQYTRPPWVDQAAPFLPWMGVWLAICSGVSVGLALELRLVLSRPLERLQHAAERVAAGDLDVPLPNPSGAPEIAAVAGAMSAARERLVTSIGLLDARNRQVETMLGALADGVALLDHEGTVVEANLSAQTLLAQLSPAWPRERALTRLLPEVPPRHFAGDAGFTTQVQRRYAGKAHTLNLTLRHVPQSSRGTGGTWVLVLNDRTTEQEAEAVKNEFLSVVTHELKTPLVSIEGFTKLLLMNKAGELNEKQRTWVTNVRVQGQTLLTMVTNLLDVTRLEGGSLTLEVRPEPLAALLDRWTAVWKPVVETRGFSFSAGTAPRDVQVRVDAFRLDQVIGNLIGNAMKFTPPGGTIGIGAHVENNLAVIDVWDTGRGVPEDAVPRLFEKFFQVQKGDTRLAGGAGLGLYIVRQLVEAQGGVIGVTSKEGAGARFSVRFAIEGASS